MDFFKIQNIECPGRQAPALGPILRLRRRNGFAPWLGPGGARHGNALIGLLKRCFSQSTNRIGLSPVSRSVFCIAPSAAAWLGLGSWMGILTGPTSQ